MTSERLGHRARFWMKVRVAPADCCWEWFAALDSHGYGKFGYEYRSVRAHRFACELSGWVLDPDLHLDHLCRNRACVNPAHLEQVTQAENTRRGASVITSCPHGHPYDEANTHFRANGRRVCRTCNRLSTARYNRRVRA